MKKMLEARLGVLGERHKTNKPYDEMVLLAKELVDSLREYNIIDKIELNPNCLEGGSVSIFISTMPVSISLKLWYNSNLYYMSFFKIKEGEFDKQLEKTFNDRGVLPINNIDEAEELILDLISNQIYNRDNKVILT